LTGLAGNKFLAK